MLWRLSREIQTLDRSRTASARCPSVRRSPYRAVVLQSPALSATRRWSYWCALERLGMRQRSCGCQSSGTHTSNLKRLTKIPHGVRLSSPVNRISSTNRTSDRASQKSGVSCLEEVVESGERLDEHVAALVGELIASGREEVQRLVEVKVVVPREPVKLF